MRSTIFMISALFLASCGKLHSNGPVSPEQPLTHETSRGPLDSFMGSFPLVEFDGDSTLSGVVEVVSNGGMVGFRVKPATGTATPAPSVEILTDVSHTVLTQEKEITTQEYKNGEYHTTIHYRFVNEKLMIDAVQCSPGMCVPTDLIAAKP